MGKNCPDKGGVPLYFHKLIYGKNCLQRIAWGPQDSGALHAQSHSNGWSEMTGAVTAFSRKAFDASSEGI